MCAPRSLQIQLAKRQRANKAGLTRNRPPRTRARVCDSQRMAWSKCVGSEARRSEVTALLRLLEPRSA